MTCNTLAGRKCGIAMALTVCPIFFMFDGAQRREYCPIHCNPKTMARAMGIAKYMTKWLKTYMLPRIMGNGKKNIARERNVLTSLTMKDNGKFLGAPSLL